MSRLAAKRKLTRGKRREGFMLLEIMVAVLMLTTVLVSLAAVAVQVASRSVAITGNSYRNGILLQEVNRLQSVPYTALSVGTTVTTVTALPYPHTRTLTITQPATNVFQVKLVITPTRTAFKKDSVIFLRRKSTSNTFDTDSNF